MGRARAAAADQVIEIAPTRLNPTDATLWDIERNPRLRTTIVAVLTLDRPVKHQHLVDLLEAASRLVPRLRQRVVSGPAGIGPPHWEIDPDFEVGEHVSFVDAPDGVDATTIAAVAEPMASTPFHRHRPLWECVYVGGTAGSSALVLKVHHSLTDGVGGVGLLDVMFDLKARVPSRDLSSIPLPIPGRRPHDPGDDADAAIRRAISLPFGVAGAALTTTMHPVRTLTGTWQGARSAARLLAPSSAPLSPLLTGRSIDRRVGMSELELDRLHRAASAHGCTINQAFFAGTIGGIAAYHRVLGKPADQLRVTMPVSFRRAGHAQAGNQWAPVRFVVPADIDDPVERMLAMRHLVEASRREKALSFSQTLAGMVQVLPSVLSSGVVGQMMHGVDVTLTNVPGLTEPHYLAGASIERMYAFAPTAGAALNVGLVSHLDHACIGTLSDAKAVAEPGLLSDLIAAGLDEVMAVAERTPRRERATPPEETRPVEPQPRAPERLSALDTGFLRLETPETPMHIGGVFVVEGSRIRDDDGHIRIDDARRRVEARLRHLPRFTRRLSEVPLGLGRPLWVDDVRFAIGQHVKLTAVAAPGSRQDLLDIGAELYATRLDRSRPLWELWLVDGLADGRVGIVEKVHHALIDGLSGVELAAAIFDAEPDPAEVENDPPSPSRRAPEPGPTAIRRLADALVEQVLDPVETARNAVSAIVSTPSQVMGQAASVAASARDMVRPAARAPSTPFNHEIGPRREVRAVSLDLERVHRARRPHHATVNDLVLATIAGAMRRWFVAEDEPLVDVHVLAPVSTRREAMGSEPGNRVGAVIVELPVGEPDPARRLEIVQRRMGRLKASHEGEGAAALLDALDHVPAIGYGALTRLVSVQPQVNFVVTNLPGPTDPLYFLGARIDEMIPIVPLGPGLGLGIAVLSYVDGLTVSLFADPDACHDLEVLADAITTEFDTLVDALDPER
jgi:diacylglycerol O-acyltransferase